jgi:phosphoribosyl-AMP cyclohydrolase
MEDYSELIQKLKFGKDGLIPAIAQDVDTNEVVMVAYMNEESLKRTLKERKGWYWSRSRQQYWLKGETSGNIQEVKQVLIDCDADTILLKIKQHGGACHEGYFSCFFREITDDGQLKIISQKLSDK